MGGGGKVANIPAYVKEPDLGPSLAILGMQSASGKPILDQKNQILSYAANMPMESWTPDIFTPGSGAMDTAGQVAAINAYKSAELEEKTNPGAQQMRQDLPKMLSEDLSAKNLKNQMDIWAGRHGLARYIGGGLQDSTIGKSAMFDAATQEGAALRRANEQAAASYLSAHQAPVAGIDPASVIAASQGAQARNMQQRAQGQQNILESLGPNLQSTTDWINQMMNSTSQATSANQANWQNYNQAMLKASGDAAALANKQSADTMGMYGQLAGVASAVAVAAL